MAQPPKGYHGDPGMGRFHLRVAVTTLPFGI